MKTLVHTKPPGRSLVCGSCWALIALSVKGSKSLHQCSIIWWKAYNQKSETVRAAYAGFPYRKFISRGAGDWEWVNQPFNILLEYQHFGVLFECRPVVASFFDTVRHEVRCLFSPLSFRFSSILPSTMSFSDIFIISQHHQVKLN